MSRPLLRQNLSYVLLLRGFFHRTFSFLLDRFKSFLGVSRASLSRSLLISSTSGPETSGITSRQLEDSKRRASRASNAFDSRTT